MIRLIGDTPTLILLTNCRRTSTTRRPVPSAGLIGAGRDERAIEPVLSGTQAAEACIVLSNLSGAYGDAAKNLRTVLKTIEKEARRQAKPITPVELGGSEIYQILPQSGSLPSCPATTRSRLLPSDPRSRKRPRRLPRALEQIVEEIRGSYPFHPSIKDIIALFRNNESYRQTRGLMQFVAGWFAPLGSARTMMCISSAFSTST